MFFVQVRLLAVEHTLLWTPVIQQEAILKLMHKGTSACTWPGFLLETTLRDTQAGLFPLPNLQGGVLTCTTVSQITPPFQPRF